MGCCMSVPEETTVADLLTVVLHTRRTIDAWDGFVEDAVAWAAPDVRGIDAAIASESLARVVVTLTRAGVRADRVLAVEKVLLHELAKRTISHARRCRISDLATLAARVKVPWSADTPQYVVWSRIRSRLRGGWTVRIDPSHISSDRWRQLEAKLGVRCNTNYWDSITRYMFVTDVEMLLGSASPRRDDATGSDVASAAAVGVPARPTMGSTRAPVERSVLLRSLTSADCLRPGSCTFDCSYCGYPFFLQDDLTRHTPECRSRVALPCPNCEETFYSERGLASHKFWCRSNLYGPRYMPDPVAWCEHCGLKTTEGNLRGGRRSAPSEPHAERCLMNRARTTIADEPPPVREFIYRTCAALRHVVPETAENNYIPVMRGHVLLHSWDVEVVRTWCDIKWGRAGEPFLCHLLYRNIEQAAINDFTDRAALEDFLRFFRAPESYSEDQRWHYALSIALRNKGAGLDRWLRAAPYQYM